MKETSNSEKKLSASWKWLLDVRKDDPLVQLHFTALIQANKEKGTPSLYFTDP